MINIKKFPREVRPFHWKSVMLSLLRRMKSIPAEPGNLNSDWMDGAPQRMWGPDRLVLTVGIELFSGKVGSKKYLMSWTVIECII